VSLRVAFLLSGSGTTLENLLRHAETGSVPVEVVVVVADRPGTKGIERARARGIATAVVERRAYREPAAFDAAMEAAIRPHAPDLVAMGGFLSLWRLPADYRGRAMNVHPALLPAFGGRGFYGDRVHRAVLEAGVKVTGCTVHFVDDEYDHGPIVAQAVVVVEENDTAESLAHRVQEAERQLYPACIRLFAEGRLQVDGRRVRVLPAPAKAPRPARPASDRPRG
jgi:formyltetrahydrofolate-dependent phosphoribosylglycinamide formyltransferase